MKADALELSRVFGPDSQLFAPLFQRPYVWNREDQWEPLWEDIRRLGEALERCEDEDDAKEVKPHFLGAVVLEAFSRPLGKPKAFSIIDGQQRLTTLQIFTVAFRDCLTDYDGKLKKQIRKVERLLFNEDVDDVNDSYKVWPTNVDRPAHQAVMQTKNPSELHEYMKEKGIRKSARIIKAYLYYHEAMSKWLKECTDDKGLVVRAECLVNALREKIRMVAINMDAQDDAQAIFETLNARGTPLLPSDLVKNYLFHLAQEENADMDALHQKYWIEFEEHDDFWRENYGVGHAQRPRIDMFLQHYLTLQTDSEIASGNIFNSFKAYVEEKPRSVDWHLKHLRDYGRHFKYFMQPPADSREGTFFFRLTKMQISTVFPFLLGLFHAMDEERADERTEILVDLESFLVRRMICRLSTRGYNRLFLDLLKHLSKVGYERSNIHDFLLKQEAEIGRWPNDKEFKQAWLTVPVYSAFTKPRVKMVLRALDAALHTSKTEKYWLKVSLTIEHLLPQNWEAHWPMPPMAGESADAYIARKDNRNHLLHTIGNLTLLTGALNPSVSNGSFAHKKVEILKHSAINLNRFLYEREGWGEEEIEDRAKALFKIAANVWPHPQ